MVVHYREGYAVALGGLGEMGGLVVLWDCYEVTNNVRTLLDIMHEIQVG